MPIYSLEKMQPVFRDRSSCWIAPDATLIGNVEVGVDVGIWFGVTIRGDNEPIRIGDRTNVQELCVMHTDPGFPLEIGDDCTIGHRAVLHGCRIGARSLIGMGAILLNGATIGEDSLVGAGALITEGKRFPPRSLIVGSPARMVRQLGEEEILRLKRSAVHYVENQRRFASGLELLDGP